LIDGLGEQINNYMAKSRTKVIFGWEEALNIREHVNNMIKDIQKYFYIGQEVFLLVAKPVTETEFYSKFIKNIGPAEIVTYECQNPTMLDLAQVYSLYQKNRQRIIIGMGGGSIMDLTKAIIGWAYHNSFIPAFPRISEGSPCYPLILIPTIAGSGSEISPYIIMTDKQGCKITNGAIYPYLSIVDPYATMSSLHYQTLYAGLTAFSQALEAFVSKNASEETDIIAYKAIELILENFPRILNNKGDKKGRENFCLASVLSGFSINAGLGLPTAMAHQFHDLPHGLILSLLLPSIIEFNYPSCREKYDAINNLFFYRGDTLSKTIQSWFNYLGVYKFEGTYRKNLETFLHSEYCIRLSSELVMENIHSITNPGEVNADDIKRLFFSLYTIPLQTQVMDSVLLF
jgi:alcohol dehydrogenase class IV